MCVVAHAIRVSESFAPFFLRTDPAPLTARRQTEPRVLSLVSLSFDQVSCVFFPLGRPHVKPSPCAVVTRSPVPPALHLFKSSRPASFQSLFISSVSYRIASYHSRAPIVSIAPSIVRLSCGAHAAIEPPAFPATSKSAHDAA